MPLRRLRAALAKSSTITSNPAPPTLRKKRSFIMPLLTGRAGWVRINSSASRHSRGVPMVLIKSLPVPAGTTPSAVRVCRRPAAVSVSVPSPPKAITVSAPRPAASRASSVACRGWSVRCFAKSMPRLLSSAAASSPMRNARPLPATGLMTSSITAIRSSLEKLLF